MAQKTLLKRITISYFSVFLVIAVFLGGTYVGYQIPRKTLNSAQENGNKNYGSLLEKEKNPEILFKDVKFGLYWDVWNKIQEQFIDRPTAEPKLFYGSLVGRVASLGDPYTVFLEPQTASSFTEELSGKFEGIGAEIAIKNNRLTIVSPLPESPAEKAGLKGGDKIYEIDGYSTDNIDLNEAVKRIRGEKGTKVTLKIMRGEELLTKEIERDTIKIFSVQFEMKENKIAYIKITNFNDDTFDRFKEAVNKALLENPKGIIIDLRNNPGGYLTQAVDIASYWVENGQVVVIEKFADGNEKPYTASGNPVLKNYPTMVLVNSGSASGSEILAGALQDYKLAELIGKKTFGKGSVQNLEEFEDGSALKITIARWLTPLGRQIDKNGIEVDEDIELTEEDYNADKDPQLDKALEMLSSIK